MKKWVLTAVAIPVGAFGLYYFLASPATFTLVTPFIAPASPSGEAIPKWPGSVGHSFPIEAVVDGHGHSTRDISVSVELRAFATAPPVSAVNNTTVMPEVIAGAQGVTPDPVK